MKTRTTVRLRRARVAAFGSTLAVTAAVGALAAAGAQAALRHFDGQVLSKSAASQTFRIETQSGTRFRFRVNGATEFDRIPGGFSGLHQGLRVEVDAKKTDRGWLAKHVEKHRSGGGGNSGSGGGGGGSGPGGY
jgi:hypothetical protein